VSPVLTPARAELARINAEMLAVAAGRDEEQRLLAQWQGPQSEMATVELQLSQLRAQRDSARAAWNDAGCLGDPPADPPELVTLERITRDIYDRKHQQIAERQQEINYLLQDSHEADSQFKFALSELISLASKAPDLFDRSNNAEKRLLIGFVFSNLALEGPTLGYSLRKPFDLLVDLAKSQEWRPILDALRTTHKGEVTSLYGRLAEHMSLTV
jgi:hypothetical protein